MTDQRVDASLDAFDALIGSLAAAGEYPTAEVAALRTQTEVPQTGEIPVQGDQLQGQGGQLQGGRRWLVEPGVEQPAEAADRVAAEPRIETPAPAQPMTRREARAATGRPW